ncbi:hypothetical protein F2Q69_00058900 [Brassica cretica]|uniref:Uncharacterized protein n=1 Tax=Brassica cretica TaxID=69181 RepID=A0A8S9RGU7_BRACR|nr:hypothetical protein F2Q69_00058900 [Brassica cretica]
MVLFFEAAWLTPLISELPEMTWITRSCRGGEMGAASVGVGEKYSAIEFLHTPGRTPVSGSPLPGSLYRKFSISRGKGEILGPDPKNSITGNRVFCLAGILGNGVPSSGDPEAGVMSGLSDEDKEIKDKPADEDALAIPVGPMTRSRTKRLNETIGGLLMKSWKQEEFLG